VEENIDFYSGIYRIPAKLKEERKQWVLEMAGLKEHRRRPTALLSGGWKQRLALGCGDIASAADRLSRRAYIRRGPDQPSGVLGLDL